MGRKGPPILIRFLIEFFKMRQNSSLWNYLNFKIIQMIFNSSFLVLSLLGQSKDQNNDLKVTICTPEFVTQLEFLEGL